MFQYRLLLLILVLSLVISTCDNSTVSIPAPELRPPASPAAVALSDSIVRLNWLTPESGASGYQIEKQHLSVDSWNTLVELGSEVNTYFDTGLTERTTYTYRMYSRLDGRTSVASELIQATTFLKSPGSFRIARVSGNYVELQWTDESDYEDSYVVQRHRNYNTPYLTIAKLQSNTTAYLDSGLLDNERYFYRIRAESETNDTSIWSDELQIITTPAPLALYAEALSDSSVFLRWVDQSTNENANIIERKIWDDNWMTIDSLSPDIRNYSDFGLTEGTVYSYRISPVIDSFRAESTEPVTILTLPKPPENLLAEQDIFARTTIHLGWTDNSNKEEKFEIQRRGGDVPDFETIAFVNENVNFYTDNNLEYGEEFSYRVCAVIDSVRSLWSNESSSNTDLLSPLAPSNLTAVPITPHTMRLNWQLNSDNEDGVTIQDSMVGFESWRTLFNLPESTVDYVLGGLEEQKTYYYRIYAFNNHGRSPFSNIAEATTPQSLPESPNDLAAEAESYNIINLRWIDNSNDETSFVLQRHFTWTMEWLQIAELEPDVIAYVDSTVVENTEYGYRIQAVNEAGVSDWSNEAIVRTPIGPPPAPTNLHVTTVNSTLLRLTWTSQTNTESGFLIERKDAITPFRQITEVDSISRLHVDSDLTPSTWYWYRLRGYNPSGISDYSRIDSARTADSIPERN